MFYDHIAEIKFAVFALRTIGPDMLPISSSNIMISNFSENVKI